ncbi:MAG: hypothetical protein E6J39_02865 [Chloroflexi bacterium]|nr:MAG: hypothetical protein E6J39_02865 [Chloroflexota bacterium]
MRFIGRGAAVLLLAAAASGCTTKEEGGTSPVAASSVGGGLPSTSATGSPPSTRPAIPAGFPIMPGAKPDALPDDATLIARWTVPVVGSAAYDFYTRALPDAGFAIVGAYPAERAALIRFRGRTGTIWQVLAELVGDRTQVTIQTDRP